MTPIPVQKEWLERLVELAPEAGELTGKDESVQALQFIVGYIESGRLLLTNQEKK